MEILHRHGKGNCATCPTRDICKELCDEADAVAGQDYVDEWFIDYASPRESDDSITWAVSMPEEVWELVDKLKITERNKLIFELRFARNYKYTQISDIFKLSISRVHQIIKEIAALLARELHKN